MSEKICETCGRRLGVLSSECNGYNDPDGSECLRLGYERTLARADRSEAEFSACKALLIAAQKRAGRAEAERAEWKDRASEARAALGMAQAALRRVEAGVRQYGWPVSVHAEARAVDRALAALPVEPARPQVTEITQRAPAARSPATPEELRHCADGKCAWDSDVTEARGEWFHAHAVPVPAPRTPEEVADRAVGYCRHVTAKHPHDWACAPCIAKWARRYQPAELARSDASPAQKTPPPSPTGDAE